MSLEREEGGIPDPVNIIYLADGVRKGEKNIDGLIPLHSREEERQYHSDGTDTIRCLSNEESVASQTPSTLYISQTG
jgi:hypothetical protein